jgi:tetratricopeptide (TPR) repeat protein
MQAAKFPRSCVDASLTLGPRGESGMKKSTCARAAAAVAICCVAVAARAQTPTSLSQDWTWCLNKERAAPDLQISGSTTVIQSGTARGKDLAVAFNQRGNARRAKGDHDRTIVDYDEAIRFDPDNAAPYNGRGNAWRAKGDNDVISENLHRRL